MAAPLRASSSSLAATDGGSITAKIDTLRKSEAQNSRVEWSPQRRMGASFLDTNHYQCAVGALIGIHTILIIQETDIRASSSQVPEWRIVVNYVLLTIYLADIALRLYVDRHLFFSNTGNLLDFFIVMADVAVEASAAVIGNIPSFAVLRVCRLSRLLRFVRFLRMFRELDIMLLGFISAMRAMFWATIMIFVILTFFSIIAVELLYPITVRLAEQGTWADCARCQRAFSTVMDANLTFMQQILAGDSWGLVSIPIIEEEPFAAIFIGLVLVVVEFGMANLIMTVIVDVANNAREADQRRRIEERAREFEVMKKNLLNLCAELDGDGSGDLSVDELLHAMDSNPRFAELMAALDIEKEDMHVVFRVLDDDHSGTVQYNEFVNQLHKIKSQDTHTLLIFIKGHLNEVRCKVSEQLALLQRDLLTSNVDMANCLRRALFGGAPLSTSASLAASWLKDEVTKGAPASECTWEGLPASPLAACGESHGTDKAPLTGRPPGACGGRRTAGLKPPSTAPQEGASEAPAGAEALRGNGDPRCAVDGFEETEARTLRSKVRLGVAESADSDGEPFLGLIKFEEAIEGRLRRLEEQVSGELTELTRGVAGRIDEQLALLQEWAGLPQQASANGQELEPGEGNVDATDTEWNASLWQPSEKGANQHSFL